MPPKFLEYLDVQFFFGLCYQEDVTSQFCLLPTDWSFVKDVLCCF